MLVEMDQLGYLSLSETHKLLLPPPLEADWATIDVVKTEFVRRQPRIVKQRVPFTEAECTLIKDAMAANGYLLELATGDRQRGVGLHAGIYREQVRFPMTLGTLSNRTAFIGSVVRASSKAGDTWLGGFAGNQRAMDSARVIRDLPKRMLLLRARV